MKESFSVTIQHGTPHLLLFFLIGGSTLFCVPVSAAANRPEIGMVQPSLPGLPPMNPAEQKQFESEMAAFQEEFNKLSPKEQDAFYQSMEDAVKKIENLTKTDEGRAILDKLDKGEMSDEELDKLVNRLVGEEKPAEPEKVVVVEKIEEAPKEPEKPKLVVLTSKQEEAVDTLNALVVHTNAFLVKVAAMPEFLGNIKQWVKRGEIQWVNPSQNWQTLKTDIEHFVAQLDRLLERDKKTGEYYHLDALLKNETLYNNIHKVQSTVSEYEPQVEEPVPPLSKKISKTSKKYIQKLITQYLEALYVLKIPQEVDVLLKKFEPRAKIAREAEEKATKEAELAIKKQAPGLARPVVAGAPREYYPYQPRYEEEVGPSYRPAYIPGSVPQRLYEEPQVKGREHGAPISTAAAPRHVPTPVPTVQDEGAKRLEELQKSASVRDQRLQGEVDLLLNKINDNIESVARFIEGSATLKMIEAHVKDDSPVDVSLVTELLPDIMRELSMRKGAVGTIDQLKRKIPSLAKRGEYKIKLQKFYDQHKKTFEQLDNQITALRNTFDTFKGSLSLEKQYAYFGIKMEFPAAQPVDEAMLSQELDKIAQEPISAEERTQKAIAYLEAHKKGGITKSEKLRELERKLPTPISLFELQDSLRSLKEAIASFDQISTKKK